MYNFIQMRLFSLVMWLPTRHIYTRVLIPTVVVQKALEAPELFRETTTVERFSN